MQGVPSAVVGRCPAGPVPARRAPYARDMAQGRDSPAGYDWEDESVPSEPEALALPDHRRGSAAQRPAPAAGADPREPPEEPGAGERAGAAEDSGPYGAPSFTDDPQRSPEHPERRRGALPPWAILGIVLVQATALVATVALVVGGIRSLTAEEPDAPAAAPTTEEETVADPAQPSSPQREPGTVTDSAGREVTDGTGRYDDPASIGEHTVSWTAWTEGTIGVTALEADLDATAPGADGQDIVQDGYRLVLATYEVHYDGPGQLAPAEELWLTGESDRTYFPDIAEGLVPEPMKRIDPLRGGETARFRSVFLVPESEIETFRLGVETFTGEILYFATA